MPPEHGPSRRSDAAPGVPMPHGARFPGPRRIAMSSLSELQAIIQDKFGIDPATIDPNKPMQEHGMDSLALVEFVFEIEDRMGLRVPEEYNHVNTLAGLAEVIDKLRAEKAAAAEAA